MTKRWQVETLMGNVWENCWRESTDEGTEGLMTFATKEDAENEIMTTKVDYMTAGMSFEQWRVVEVIQ